MSSRRKIFLTAAILMFALLQSVQSQQLSVVIGEEDSLLKLYAESDGVAAYPLWDQDPLSSGWSLIVDGTSITPADSEWVRESSRYTDDVYRLAYSNRSLSLTQDLVISSGASHALYTVTMKNNGAKSIEVIPALLLDTSLGETTGLPFLSSDGSYIRSERVFQDSGIPEWIRTVRNNTTPSLTVMLRGDTATRPENVYVANWLRLKQAGASYSPVAGRSFDFLPFSEGDSALMLTYDSRLLEPGSSYEIKLLMGMDENPPDAESFLETIVASGDSVNENIRLRSYTIRQRLREISRLLDSVDAILVDEESLTGMSVANLENQVKEQERLRAEYENL